MWVFILGWTNAACLISDCLYQMDVQYDGFMNQLHMQKNHCNEWIRETVIGNGNECSDLQYQ